MATLKVSDTQISPLDALWSLFKSQPKSIRKAFTKRLKEEESSEELKDNVVKHIKAVRSGKEKTYSFIHTLLYFRKEWRRIYKI